MFVSAYSIYYVGAWSRNLVLRDSRIFCAAKIWSYTVFVCVRTCVHVRLCKCVCLCCGHAHNCMTVLSTQCILVVTTQTADCMYFVYIFAFP